MKEESVFFPARTVRGSGINAASAWPIPSATTEAW